MCHIICGNATLAVCMCQDWLAGLAWHDARLITQNQMVTDDALDLDRNWSQTEQMSTEVAAVCPSKYRLPTRLQCQRCLTLKIAAIGRKRTQVVEVNCRTMPATHYT